jgi:hypothetical protein
MQRLYILSEFERALIVAALQDVQWSNGLNKLRAKELAQIILNSPSVEVTEIMTDPEVDKNPELPWNS